MKIVDRVVDGDTLVVDGQTVRLYGIDAPERIQMCNGQAGMWACGHIATEKMKILVGGGMVDCVQKDIDRYSRSVSLCMVNSQDIGAALVADGYAWAYTRYSSAYIPEETHARRARLGIFAQDNQPAWEFRKSKRNKAKKPHMGEYTQNVSDCVIKGNISSSGKIYHTPSSPWYHRTKIDTRKGERWFCSEGDAKAAGWRAPRH